MDARLSKRLHRLCCAIIILTILFYGALFTGSTPQIARQSYIIQGDDMDQVSQLVKDFDGEITSQLNLIHGVGALLTADAADRLRTQPGITRLTLNAGVRAADSNPQGVGPGEKAPATDYPDVVGADFTWQEGVTGDGVTVAVIDSGIGWQPGVIKGEDGKQRGRFLAWKDFVSDSRLPFDPNGHGTHIAGVIANNQMGADGEANGVAPDVNLVGVRVLDRWGYGTYEQVVQGIQWVVENRAQYQIRVMNISLVAPVQSPYWADPLNQALMQAWASGIVVVTAAGNGGPNPLSIGVPGNNPYLITVGAFTDHYTPYDWNDDYLAPFSSAGPTLDGFVKPDLVAPGGHIVSTMLPGAYLIRLHEANRVSPMYFSMAGSSQSTAVVSGVAALVLTSHPELTPNQVKYRLMASAFPWVDLETTNALYSMWQQGAGRVSAPDAVFGDLAGEANYGMDIAADLAGTQHYEGFSYFDGQEFRLRGEYGNWSGGYGNWSGGYGNWSGGYGNWSGGYGNWSGGYGNWAGSYGNWSGGYGNWSGGYGNWSGGYGNWSGGYGNWSGGYGNWSGGYGNWSGGYGNWSGNDENWFGEYGNWSGVEDWTGSVSMPAWIDEP